MDETIILQTEGGCFSSYVVKPQNIPAPVVVVLHEVLGVNEDIRLTCRRLAGQGFIAIAPELFWRQERGVELSPWLHNDWNKGLALNQAYDRDAGVRDIVATVRAARQLNGATGKVGVMGFCIGGLVTFITAGRHHIDAAVVYYGSGIENYLGYAHALSTPVMMHLAEEDEYISKAAQTRIKAALASAPSATVYSYSGQNHAFARHAGPHYHAEAAALANGRTVAFFTEHLGLLGSVPAARHTKRDLMQ